MTPVLRKYLAGAVLAVVSFIGSGMIVRQHYATSLAAATDSVSSAHVALVHALDAAKAESAWAASQEIVAAGYSAAAAREHAKVLALTDTANVLRGRFLATASTAPDTCGPVVAVADALVKGVDATNSALRTELDSTRAASDAFRSAADSARTALARLTPAATRVDTAAQGVVKAVREPFWSRVTPKWQVTVGPGLTTDKRFVVAVVVGPGYKL